MHVYLIQNTINGKVYVGQHAGEDLDWYLRVNFVKAKRGDVGKKLLYRAMRKYGPENFNIRSIYTPANKVEMNLAEITYIKFFGARNNTLGYNIAEGGAGGNTREGYKNSPEHIEKQRKGVLGIPKSEEHKANLSKARMGMKCPWTAESNKRRASDNPTPSAIRNRRYRERKKLKQEANQCL